MSSAVFKEYYDAGISPEFIHAAPDLLRGYGPKGGWGFGAFLGFSWIFGAFVGFSWISGAFMGFE